VSCSRIAAASRNSASWLSSIASSARAASCPRAVKGPSFTFIVMAGITRSSLRSPSLARSRFGAPTSIPNEPTARGRKRDPGRSEDHPISAEYRSSDRGIQGKFFISFGFSPGNWAALKTALLNHSLNNPVTSQTSNPFGQKFEVGCSLIAPDGRNPCIISVWIIEPPDHNPRFITAYSNP
jgi:hypothetical protein